MSDNVDTSAEACAIACILVSNPAGETRHVGWQKRVNDLIRALRDERDTLRAELAAARKFAAAQGNENEELQEELDKTRARIDALLANSDEAAE